jgi:hypothetical protein
MEEKLQGREKTKKFEVTLRLKYEEFSIGVP